MSRARFSKGGGWSDGEKLKVIFSLLEANGKIEYSKAYIPPGRTLKAVHHMIQKEKERMKSFQEAEDGGGSDPNEGSASSGTPSKPTKGSRAPKATKGDAATKPPKTGGKRKRGGKEEDREEDISAHDDNDPVKKIKQEMQDALDTAEKLRMDNAFGDSYGDEA